jgi:DeoR/GlpR family transcriptional regulator of sugar metabolism
MYKEERRQNIREMIESRGQVSVSELSRAFDVSEMTVRRDLLELAERGFVVRTHGGAIAPRYPRPNVEPLMMSRLNDQLDEKRKIARAVVKMIGPGETILLSSGTTTYWIAKNLINRGDLTVVVNNIITAGVLAECEEMQVIVAGGFLRRSELSLVGHFVETMLKDLRVDKVILGVRGIHPEFGLSSDNPQELKTDRAMMSISDHVMVVADHTKFGFIAPSLTAPVTAAKTIVTTRKAPVDIVKSIRAQGVNVIVV